MAAWLGGRDIRAGIDYQAIRRALNRLLESALETGFVTGATADTLTVDRVWTANCWKDFVVEITEGKGAGQYRLIKSNTANTLTVDPPWNVVPDATSIYAIRYPFIAMGNTAKVGGIDGVLQTPRDWSLDFQHIGPARERLDWSLDEKASVLRDRIIDTKNMVDLRGGEIRDMVDLRGSGIISEVASRGEAIRSEVQTRAGELRTRVEEVRDSVESRVSEVRDKIEERVTDLRDQAIDNVKTMAGVVHLPSWSGIARFHMELGFDPPMEPGESALLTSSIVRTAGYQHVWLYVRPILIWDRDIRGDISISGDIKIIFNEGSAEVRIEDRASDGSLQGTPVRERLYPTMRLPRPFERWAREPSVSLEGPGYNYILLENTGDEGWAKIKAIILDVGYKALPTEVVSKMQGWWFA
jgi:ElaB/YqjD/DUF883 family membrane-anchored ribosome-binding protein